MKVLKKVSATLGSLAVAGSLMVLSTPDAHAATGLNYLEEGSYGAGVACAQWAENWYLDPQYPHVPIAVDGSFGPKTYAETKWFQEQEGLSQDGVIGPQTGGKVIAVINQYMNYDGDLKIWNGYWLSDCYYHVPTSY